MHEANPDHTSGDLRRRIAPIVAGATVALIVVGAGLVFWLRGGSLLPHPRVVDDPPPRRVAVEPGAGRPAPGGRALLDGRPFDLLAPPAGEPGSFRPPVALSPPYDVIDSMTFRTPDRKIRLAHIDGVRRGDVCYGEDGLKFACGLMGRAVLSNFLRSNRVVCYPAFDGAGDDEDETLRATCFLGATDLAEHQIRAGVARPLPAATGRYRAALEAAREARTGAWNGGWTLMALPEDKRDGL